MRSPVSAFVVSAVLATVSPLPAQAWSMQDLRERVDGFHSEGLRSQIHQIAELLTHRDDAYSAICATIQGDHREYLLKIERLLDQLADDRWAVREDAERQLVEIGARAMAMIAERKKSGATLEERVRSARIEDDIAARGTEEEEAEIRMLRGLVATAFYLGADQRLANALVSATGHTDPIVVEGALRALGAVGGDANAKFLANRFRAAPEADGMQRRTLLCSLTDLAGAATLTEIEKLIDEDELTRDELLGLMLDLRRREGGMALVDKLKTHVDPVIQAVAAIRLPKPAGQDPQQIKVVLGDLSEFVGPLLGIGSTGIEIGQIEGIPQVRVPRDQCNTMSFGREATNSKAGHVRVFTSQGSLLSGELVVVDEERIAIESPIFGLTEIPRADVQGIALDAGLDRLVGASMTHDRVRMSDGSLMDGKILAISGTNVKLESSDGAKQDLSVEDVAGLLFKRPQPASRDPEVFTRVELDSGDRLLIHLGAVDTENIGFLMPGIGPAVVPMERLTRIEFGVGGGALWGFTLVADYSENTIFELDDQHKVVFKLEEMYGVWDAECLDNGNLLIVEFALGRVIEMRRDRTEVWSFDKLKNPYDADRLPNGNTLIADTYGSRVIEVNPQGEIVWSFDKQSKPLDVERLANGNTLIADGKKDRVIEVDRSGKIVWERKDLEGVWDVDRLPNGNTLITQRRSGHRVFEIDREGNVVFEIADLTSPSDADRLPNGHTVVAEDGKVREFDRFGHQVWEHAVSWSVEVNRY